MTSLAVATSQVALYALVITAQRRIASGPLAVSPVLLYLAATVGLFGGYVWAIRASRALSLPRRDRLVLIAAPVAVWVALAMLPPTLSMDVYSYLAHGHQVASGANPYLTPTSEVDREPYGQQLRTSGWLPVHGLTPYGPLWTRAEAGAFGTPGDAPDLASQVRRLKLPTALAGLLAALLIWRILGHLAPTHQLTGTVLYLWNPLVVIELAAEGHNDAVMLALTLLGLLLVVRGHAASGAAAVTSAALVKLSALVVAPPLGFYVLRQKRTVWARAALAVLIGGWLGWLAYGSLWAGWATFAGLRLHATPMVAPSTGGLLFYYLTRAHAPEPSAQAISLLLMAALATITLTISVRVADVRALLLACGQLALVLVVLASSYWPWYVVLPVGLLALSPQWPLSVPLVMLFSLAGRLIAPLDRLRLHGLVDWPDEVVISTIVGLWLPAVMAAILVGRHWRAAGPAHRGYLPAGARLKKLMLPMAPPATPAERMSSRS